MIAPTEAPDRPGRDYRGRSYPCSGSHISVEPLKDTPVERLSMGALVGDDSPIADLPRDATLVVAGPPMTGKYHVMLSILVDHADDAIVISTKNSAGRVVADYGEIAGEIGDRRVGVIDCVNHPEQLDGPDTPLVKHVQSPENLTKIGVRFTELFEQFYEEDPGARIGVGIHSISQLLMHSELKNVYQFLQVLMGQIRSADWLGVAVVDTNIDEEDLQTIYHHFDGIIQTRENEAGQRELRVRGLRPTTSEWAEF